MKFVSFIGYANRLLLFGLDHLLLSSSGDQNLHFSLDKSFSLYKVSSESFGFVIFVFAQFSEQAKLSQHLHP